MKDTDFATEIRNQVINKTNNTYQAILNQSTDAEDQYGMKLSKYTENSAKTNKNYS